MNHSCLCSVTLARVRGGVTSAWGAGERSPPRGLEGPPAPRGAPPSHRHQASFLAGPWAPATQNTVQILGPRRTVGTLLSCVHACSGWHVGEREGRTKRTRQGHPSARIGPGKPRISHVCPHAHTCAHACTLHMSTQGIHTISPARVCTHEYAHVCTHMYRHACERMLMLITEHQPGTLLH